MIFNLAFNKMQQEEVLFNNPSIYRNYTATQLKWLPNIKLYDCAFYNCTYIQSGVFTNHSTLTQVYFPKCSLILNNTFLNCISLVTASFPTCKNISRGAFAGCTQLT